MPHHRPDTDSLQAHPNIRTAADMLGISASTLSRRRDVMREGRGERDVVLAPSEVLRLGAIYRKRSLNDVAHALLDHAGRVGPEEQRRVEDEIEAYFDANTMADQRDQLVALARRFLPADLCASIEAVLEESGGELPQSLRGDLPLPDHDRSPGAS